MSYTLICAECGKKFEAWRRTMKYCSKECAKKADNRKAREVKKQNSTIEKKCAYCGKTFFTYSDHIRFCNKSCSARARATQYGNNVETKKRDCETVNIRIIKPLDGVYPEMMPEVGSVHKADKLQITNWLKRQVYIIRSIGRHGLLVRHDECVEVAEDVSE